MKGRPATGHFGTLAVGSRPLQSLPIVQCGLQELPASLGFWAARLRHLYLSINDLLHLLHFLPSVASLLHLQNLDLSYNRPLHVLLPAPLTTPHEPYRCERLRTESE